MKEINKVVGSLPHMSSEQGKRISDFIVENGLKDILELGFRYGVSTCYMAAALARNGGGKIVTIDRLSAKELTPNIENLLSSLDLLDLVEIFYEPTSYNWRLMKFIEEGRESCFDFVYIDGAHNWYDDGFAFFLVDRMLRPGGWIIFDDLYWTYDSSPTLKDSEAVKNMPIDEKTTPQVEKIYDLLVKRHQNYSNFKVMHGWAYAQKNESLGSNNSLDREIVTEKVYIDVSLTNILSRIKKLLVK